MRKRNKKTKVEFHGKKYELKLDFANVLKAYEIFDDDVLLNFEKNIIFIFMLCPKAYKIKTELLGEFVKSVFDEHLNFESQNAIAGNVQSVDFKQDEMYIFSAFKQAYGLDLRDDYLSWWEFVSLFKSLPEDTKICEIMDIRTRPLPQPTKHNAAEIQNLLKLKQHYALGAKAGAHNFEEGLRSLFDTLKRKAVS